MALLEECYDESVYEEIGECYEEVCNMVSAGGRGKKVSLLWNSSGQKNQYLTAPKQLKSQISTCDRSPNFDSGRSKPQGPGEIPDVAGTVKNILEYN